MDNYHAARTLFHFVATSCPDVYERILHILRPHTLEGGVLRLFQQHLRRSVPDLQVFNDSAAAAALSSNKNNAIADFCLRFVTCIRRQFPTPGDAFGIQLTCRLTKSDTQVTLDSKHLRSDSSPPPPPPPKSENNSETFHLLPSQHNINNLSQRFNVDKDLRYELDLFTNHTQLFELANTHKYASVFTRNYSVQQLAERLPEGCILEKGNPLDKGKTCRNGEYKYLQEFPFIIVSSATRHNNNRVLYKSFKNLQTLLLRLDPQNVVCFSNVRYIFKQCGLISFYFNMLRIAERQLFQNNSHTTQSVYANDVCTVLKYQCCTGQPLPLTRDGLVKNAQRSPLEILSFEAPKKNYARLCTLTSSSPEEITYPVQTSADKIFFGQQFNEGTGYRFDVMPE